MTVTNPAGRLAAYAASLTAEPADEPALDTGPTDEDYLGAERPAPYSETAPVEVVERLRVRLDADLTAPERIALRRVVDAVRSGVFANMRVEQRAEHSRWRAEIAELLGVPAEGAIDGDLLTALRGRVAPAAEPLDPEEVATLPEGSLIVECTADGTPIPGGDVFAAPLSVDVDTRWRLLYRAPDEPIRVGLEVRNRRTLDRLPVGTVLRVGWSFTIAVRSVNGWSQNGEALDPDRLVGYTVTHGAGRVIDLPQAAQA